MHMQRIAYYCSKKFASTRPAPGRLPPHLMLTTAGLWAIFSTFHFVNRSITHVVHLTFQSARAQRKNIAWLRLCDDVGLTNQVWALKPGPGIQKNRQVVQLPFQSTFNCGPFSKHYLVTNIVRYPVQFSSYMYGELFFQKGVQWLWYVHIGDASAR